MDLTMGLIMSIVMGLSIYAGVSPEANAVPPDDQPLAESQFDDGSYTEPGSTNE